MRPIHSFIRKDLLDHERVGPICYNEKNRLERRAAGMSDSRTVAESLQGRWLLVSADDDSWERLRQDCDFILEFGAATRYRIVMKPKSKKAKALFASRSEWVHEEVYVIEDGLFVQVFGDCQVLSRASTGRDGLVFERVGVRACWLRFVDDSEWRGCKVVLRR